MEVLLQTYYILLPIIVTALVGWVGVLLKDQKKKEMEQDRNRKANSVGLMLVLRYMLHRYHSEYKIQGKITYAQYKDWVELYKAYETLGGNSVAVDWNNDVEDMKKCDYADERSPFELLLEKGMK